jgi:type III secretory pathway lipoprotein EscJ
MPNGEAPISEAKIQQFVANSVESLDPRDVSVIITYLTSEGVAGKPELVRNVPSSTSDFYVGTTSQQSTAAAGAASSESLIGLKLDEKSKGKLKIYILIFFIVLILLSAALILSIVQASRMRRMFASSNARAGNEPAIEGRVMNEGPPELPGREE